jgi:hypothetical protein
VTKDELIEALDALEADVAWSLIVAFVAEWLEQGDEHRVGHPMIAFDWREEMA